MTGRSKNIALSAFAVICIPLSLPGYASDHLSREGFGSTPSGIATHVYSITSARAQVKITDYGARIVSIRVPDRDGRMSSVVLGYERVEEYMSPLGSFMGATIGRYANRIAGGRFTLDGKRYQIPIGHDGNALHGGPVGFNQKVWKARKVKDGVEMALVSHDGDMGFPGQLHVNVRFTLVTHHGEPALVIRYRAESSSATVVNLTNHAFFNLSNDRNTPVVTNLAMIAADSYTPSDSSLIPTGEISTVRGTPFDFTVRHPIGTQIPKTGYDTNFVLKTSGLDDAVAEVDDLESGRTLKVFTTEPGLQFLVPWDGAAHNGNLEAKMRPVAAFCLETQHFPDSPNHPQFPSTNLRAGHPFRSLTIYQFGVSKR